MPSQSMLATVRYANPVTQMRWNSHSPSIRYIQPKEKEEHKKDDPYTTPRRHSRQSLLRETTTPKTTVYVGNLFFDVTAEDLREHFEQFGAVENSVLVHDSRGMSKG
jgi:RNA recognition motif-containing protein